MPGSCLGAERSWQLTWFDVTGSSATAVARIGSYNSLCLSGDGRRLVYDAFDPQSGNVDLWSLDLADGATSRLTFDPAADFYPTCAPSGDELIFSSTRAGFPNLCRMSMSAPGGEQPLMMTPMAVVPTQWSRDGRYLLYVGFSAETNWDVWVLPLEGGQPSAYTSTGDEEKNGQMSPDGRWIAFTRIHDGSEDVYVQPFPSSGATWQVSRGGGRQPQWREDGRQLLYVSLDKKIMAADVEPSTSAAFVYRPPRVVVNRLAGGGMERTYQGNLYAVGADGGRFLLAIAGEETVPITVALNWPSLIERTRGSARGGRPEPVCGRQAPPRVS